MRKRLKGSTSIVGREFEDVTKYSPSSNLFCGVYQVYFFDECFRVWFQQL